MQSVPLPLPGVCVAPGPGERACESGEKTDRLSLLVARQMPVQLSPARLVE